MSVAAHLIAYGDTSTDLFRAAIMQSGSPTTNTFSSLNQTQPALDQLLTNVSCEAATDHLQCLREVPIDVLNKTMSLNMWFPAIDGTLIPESPTAQLKRGNFLAVPVLHGTVTDEGTYFGTKHLNTTEQFRTSYQTQFPALTNASMDRLLELYVDDNSLGSPYNTGDGYLPTGLQDKRSCALAGDIVMIGPRRLMSETLIKQQKDVWTFRFNQPPTYNALTYGPIDLGVTHGKDNAYIFGHPENNRTGDVDLMSFMMGSWISFVTDLDPNGHGMKGEPHWPRYSNETKNMVLTRHGRTLEDDDWRKEGIAFINGLGAQLGK